MNFGNMMKQAQKMQAKMAQMQEELKNEVLEASAGGGMVKVTITGDMQIKSIAIDPSAIDPDDVEHAPGHGRPPPSTRRFARRRSSPRAAWARSPAA